MRHHSRHGTAHQSPVKLEQQQLYRFTNSTQSQK